MLTNTKKPKTTKQSTRVGKSGKPRPTDIDARVGRRLRTMRIMQGISQQQLGEAINLSFQQIQKYERGDNRIAASRLYALAEVLEVDIAAFFRDDDDIATITEHAVEADRQLLGLIRYFMNIEHPGQRRRIFDLVKELSSLAEEEAEGDL